MNENTGGSRIILASKAAFISVLIALLMTGSIIGIFLLFTKDGAPLSTDIWKSAILQGVGLSRRALLVSAVLGLLWSCLIWRKNIVMKFLLCILCTGIFEMLTRDFKMDIVAGMLVCCITAAIIFGIYAFRYNIRHGGTTTKEAGKYKEAMTLFEEGKFGEADIIFRQMLSNPKQFSREQLSQIKVWDMICLAKLGRFDEAKMICKPDLWFDKFVWGIMTSNFGLAEGYHEMKPMEGMISHTDSIIPDAVIDKIGKNADYITTIDDVMPFDSTIGPSMYFYLASQVQYFRMFEPACLLLERAFRARKPRERDNQNMNPVNTERIYDLAGDLFFKTGKMSEAVKAYNISLSICYKKSIQDKRDRAMQTV